MSRMGFAGRYNYGDEGDKPILDVVDTAEYVSTTPSGGPTAVVYKPRAWLPFAIGGGILLIAVFAGVFTRKSGGGSVSSYKRRRRRAKR